MKIAKLLAGTVAAEKAAGAVLTPLIWMKQPVACTLAVPVLVNLTMQTFVAPVQDCTCALTCAELVNDPIRPKTNPVMAMAEMSVIARRITVARTGEIDFLLLLGIGIFNVCSLVLVSTCLTSLRLTL